MDGSVRGATLRGLATAARGTLGDDAVDALIAAASVELRAALSRDDASWLPVARHVELLTSIEAAQPGAVDRVSARAIAARLRRTDPTVLPAISPSCVIERLDAIVGEEADWIRFELQDRTLVSARWRIELRAGVGPTIREWLTSSVRAALMAAGAPDACADLVLDADGRRGELRVEWA